MCTVARGTPGEETVYAHWRAESGQLGGTVMRTGGQTERSRDGVWWQELQTS